MTALVLYNYEMDESACKVRLLSGFLGLPLELKGVNLFPGNEHRSAAFLSMSPEGRLPVLQQSEFTLCGAEAILAYLALAHDPTGAWLPREPSTFAMVQRWLTFSAVSLEPAIRARQNALFDVPGDLPALRSAAEQAFNIMEDHMIERGFEQEDWFAADHPTIADVALFPSFALSRDFGIDHDEYPALRRWARRFRAIKGFRSMPGIPDYH